MHGVNILYLMFAASISAANAVEIFKRYEPNWKSLDSRPLPEWYDDAKIGIFLHWGVFSVPSYDGAWFWERWQDTKSQDIINFMKKNYPPNFKYQDFGPGFTAEFYNPDDWSEIFEAAGAKYVVLTSKHHEGYTLWPSSYSWAWNALDVGPGRDLLGDLAKSIKRNHPHIHFGLYHSLYEWFNPLYLRDKINKYSTRDFVTTKTMPELYELVNTYEPEIVWSDGDWEASENYWNSTGFLAWLFNDSPVKDSVVVNDRWGRETHCRHGSFYNCHDRYNPGVLQKHKWENCMTLDKHTWSYNRASKATSYLTMEELLKVMAETISCGGNLLINAGPTHDGMIDPIMEDRLRHMGEWLAINGEGIYNSRPWVFQNDTLTPDIWYTKSKENPPTVYAFVLNWPKHDTLVLGAIQKTPRTMTYMLGYPQLLSTDQKDHGMEVAFPRMNEVSSKWAWVLKMEGVKPTKQRLP